jgi:hypothetical protein
MSDLYHFAKVGEEDATRFWKDTPWASIFTSPDYLVAFADAVDYWVLTYRGNQVYYWPVPLDSKGAPTRPSYSYYCGPCPSSGWLSLPCHRQYNLQQTAMNVMIQSLLKSYGSLALSLSTHQTDVRPFDWWNYHGPPETRFCISPRYSAVIDLKRFENDQSLLLSYRYCRRNEIYRTRKLGSFVESTDVVFQHVVDTYAETTNSSLSPDSYDTMRRDIKHLMELVAKGHGFVTQLHSKENDATFAYFSLVLVAKGCANLVLSLTPKSFRYTGVAALGTHTTIMKAKTEWAAHTFDFNGANSPNRGDDKHSYGAVPALYFDINYGG